MQASEKLRQRTRKTMRERTPDRTDKFIRPFAPFIRPLALFSRPFAGCIVAIACATTTSLPAPKRLQASDIDTITLHGHAKQLAYGADMLQYGELRIPKGRGRFPVAIVIHGGCYLSTYASVRNSAALAEALTDAGIATWNIEYRRYDNMGGAWPGTFKDVADATDYVRTLARTELLDTSRVVAIGHSAGGQLALWLPSRSRLARGTPLFVANPLRITGVVALGPITDMQEYQTRERDICGNPAIETVLGGFPAAVPDRVKMVSPILRVPLNVPTVLIAGANDGIAPRKALDAYATAARAKGDSVRIITTAGEGHFDAIAPGRAAGKAAIAAVKALVGLPK